jgi:hypothetical protein
VPRQTWLPPLKAIHQRTRGCKEAVSEAVDQHISPETVAATNGNADGAIDLAAAVSIAGADAGTSINPFYLSIIASSGSRSLNGAPTTTHWPGSVSPAPAPLELP